MGTIVEFYTAQSPDSPDISARHLPPTLVESLSINSRMVERLLDALAGTELDSLIGDGSDSDRSVYVAPTKFHMLQAQSASRSLQPDDVTREIYETVTDAIDEAVWAQRGLLVVVR